MLAQNPGQSLNAYAYEDIPVTSGAVVVLTAAKYKPASGPQDRAMGNRAKVAYITNDGGAVRYTVDGTTPVTAGGTGHLLGTADATSPLIITDFIQIQKFQAIADSTSSKLRVTYMR